MIATDPQIEPDAVELANLSSCKRHWRWHGSNDVPSYGYWISVDHIGWPQGRERRLLIDQTRNGAVTRFVRCHCSLGLFVHAYVDAKTQRPCAIPPQTRGDLLDR